MLDIELLLSFAAGVMIGIPYFAFLRWTVWRLVQAKQPTIWLHGGALIRLGIALPLFFFVSAGSWQNLLACLAGFAVARWVLIAGLWGGVRASRTLG